MRSNRPAARRVLILLAVALAGGARLAASEKTVDLHHTVRRGQTLFSIARSYGLNVSAVMEFNGLTTSRLRIGQKLRILLEGLRGVLR